VAELRLGTEPSFRFDTVWYGAIYSSALTNFGRNERHHFAVQQTCYAYIHP